MCLKRKKSTKTREHPAYGIENDFSRILKR